MRAKLPELSRRQLLVGGGAGIGLLVAFHFWPRETQPPFGSEGGAGRFSHYLKIDPRGGITAIVPQIEYGQGVWTAFAAMIAHELGTPADAIAVEPAPPGPGLENHALEKIFDVSLRATAGATSIRAFERPVRQAAAIARAMLTAEAAQQLGVEQTAVTVSGTDMTAGGARVAIADIAEAAAERSVPRSISLRPWSPPDPPARRVDIPAKARGAWRFAADVRLPNMVFAAARLAPPMGRIVAVDRARAENRAGIETLIEREDWIAALSPSWWEAEQAMIAANVRYSAPDIDTNSLAPSIESALSTSAVRTVSSVGDAKSVLDAADGPIVETFTAVPLPPADLEPFTATARRRSDGGLDIWSASLAPDATRDAVAAATRLSVDNITFFPMPAGGSHARALEQPAAAIAATIAMETGRSVQLSLSPSHSAAIGRLAPAMGARIALTPGPDGLIGGWHGVFADTGGLGSELARLADRRGIAPDGSGLIPPYAITDMQIEQTEVPLEIASGDVAAQVAAFRHFANEQAIERLIRALQAEPLAFRLAMAGPRLAPVITAAGRLAAWDGGRGSMGLACAVMDGSAMALIIDAVGGPANARVNAITAVVDAGRIVDTALATSMIEAGVIDGIQRAFAQSPEMMHGMAKARPFAPALRTLPTVRIELAESNAEPGGLSRIGAALAPAALANALSTGQNTSLRSLPFSLQGGA